MQHASRHRGAMTIFRWSFILCMLAFCFFMAWHTWTIADLRFQVDDIALSLETSRQRERKQQYEYDQVVAAIPLTEAALAETQPKADAMVQAVADLKAQRKAARTLRDSLAAELDAVQQETTPIREAADAAIAAQQTLTAEVALLQAQIDRLSAEAELLRQRTAP